MIIQPHRSEAVVTEDLRTQQTMRAWMDSITEMVNFLEIAEGNGSPEGVVEARKKKLYFNNTGSAGTFVYIKTTDTGDTGWVAIG